MPISDEEAQQYAVSGPFAADCESNQYAGKTLQQTPEQYASRMAGLRSKLSGGWISEWAQEVPEQLPSTE